jgi:hypothetical protein
MRLDYLFATENESLSHQTSDATERPESIATCFAILNVFDVTPSNIKKGPAMTEGQSCQVDLKINNS